MTTIWCFDCRAETSWPLAAGWQIVRGVYRCARCTAFDATRTPKQIRSIVTPPYAERELRLRLFAAST